MAERATVNQIVQLGVEATPGTGVAANRQIQATNIEPAIKTSISPFTPLGGKFATLAALGQEWVEAKISGQGSYSDMAYLLAGLLNYAAPVQQGGTAAYLWTFTPAQYATDSIKTYTVESGSSIRAAKFSYGLVRELTLAINRSSIDVSGTMLGQALQDGITMTASPTLIDPVPMQPTEVEVYLDSTAAGIGGTKLTRVLSAELAISDRFSPVWPLDAAVSGFAAHVETAPKASLKLLVEADANGMAPLTAVRAGAKRWIRVKSTGATIASTYKYSFIADLCGVISDVGEFSDQDGVYAIEWTFDVAYDATWQKALTIALTNTLTGL